MGGQELPPGWAWATLGEVCDVIGGITVDKNRGEEGTVEVPYLRVANVQRGRLDLRTMKTIRIPLGRLAQLSLQDGDVLLNEGGDRDKVGRGWVWEGQVPECTFQNHVFRARIRGEVLNPFFLSLYLNEFGRAHFLAGAKQTTNLASIALSAVKTAPILVAPRAEQDRIVAAIGTLFDELDEAEAALTRAREGVEQFRASLLHAACTGQLTAAWRAANPSRETGADLLRRILAERRAAWERTERDRLEARGALPRGDGWKARYEEPREPDRDELPHLPVGWTWTTVEQLAAVTGGLTKNSMRAEFELQVPYLRVANVGDAVFKLGDLRVIGVDPAELPRLTLKTNDLLFVEGNGSADQIGRVALWSGQISPCIHQNHLIKARPVIPGLGTWLLTWFRSPLGRRSVQDAASSTSGLHTLSIGKISVLPCPLPPIDEIEKVTEAVANLLADEADIARGLDSTEPSNASLRQSILHAAFTGRLVPQNPSDEPATALLARLRTTAPTRRPTRGARSGTQA